ncbi:cation:proton antiporter [Streptomyces parvulus]|uniref:cation:proton antiporter domain-containing protein n=1 Tax=Streptomyces parvulus TaxID=146923 RepID=UPI00369F1C38
MSPDAMIAHFVGASALTLGAAHTGGLPARRLRRPRVVGQLAAGIALGPPLLGAVAPGVRAALFPAATGPALTGFAQFALVVFLSAVGYELDPKVLGDRARTSLVVALASFARGADDRGVRGRAAVPGRAARAGPGAGALPPRCSSRASPCR